MCLQYHIVSDKYNKIKKIKIKIFICAYLPQIHPFGLLAWDPWIPIKL